MKKVLLSVLAIIVVTLTGCTGANLHISSDYTFGKRKEAKFGDPIANIYYSTAKTALVTGEPVDMNMFFTQEYRYRGFIKSILKISYREFSVKDFGTLIKPDFSYTYEYEITLPDTIHLNSIKVLVHKANNQGIEYTVLDDGGLVDSLRTKYKSTGDMPK